MISYQMVVTVPQIFFGNRHIGGYDDLKKYEMVKF